MSGKNIKIILFAAVVMVLFVPLATVNGDSSAHEESDTQSDIASAIESKLESHGIDLEKIEGDIDRVKEGIENAKGSGDVEKEAELKLELMDLKESEEIKNTLITRYTLSQTLLPYQTKELTEEDGRTISYILKQITDTYDKADVEVGASVTNSVTRVSHVTTESYDTTNISRFNCSIQQNEQAESRGTVRAYDTYARITNTYDFPESISNSPIPCTSEDIDYAWISVYDYENPIGWCTYTIQQGFVTTNFICTNVEQDGFLLIMTNAYYDGEQYGFPNGFVFVDL